MTLLYNSPLITLLQPPPFPQYSNFLTKTLLPFNKRQHTTDYANNDHHELDFNFDSGHDFDFDSRNCPCRSDQLDCFDRLAHCEALNIFNIFNFSDSREKLDRH